MLVRVYERENELFCISTNEFKGHQYGDSEMRSKQIWSVHQIDFALVFERLTLVSRLQSYQIYAFIELSHGLFFLPFIRIWSFQTGPLAINTNPHSAHYNSGKCLRCFCLMCAPFNPFHLIVQSKRVNAECTYFSFSCDLRTREIHMHNSECKSCGILLRTAKIPLNKWKKNDLSTSDIHLWIAITFIVDGKYECIMWALSMFPFLLWVCVSNGNWATYSK